MTNPFSLAFPTLLAAASFSRNILPFHVKGDLLCRCVSTSRLVSSRRVIVGLDLSILAEPRRGNGRRFLNDRPRTNATSRENCRLYRCLARIDSMQRATFQTKRARETLLPIFPISVVVSSKETRRRRRRRKRRKNGKEKAARSRRSDEGVGRRKMEQERKAQRRGYSADIPQGN